MLEAIFQALFSYRPVVFQQGEFRFDIGTGSLVAAALAGTVMVAAAITYNGVRSKGRLRDRLVLTALRMGANYLWVDATGEQMAESGKHRQRNRVRHVGGDQPRRGQARWIEIDQHDGAQRSGADRRQRHDHA